jgi:hypothetical protein
VNHTYSDAVFLIGLVEMLSADLDRDSDVYRLSRTAIRRLQSLIAARAEFAATPTE